MIVRAGATVAAGLVCAAFGCGSGSPTAPTAPGGPVPGRPLPVCTGVVWSADHETGDLSQWYVAGGGGEINSGLATSVASLDVARSGRYSARATITTPSVGVDSGVRLFRWSEGRTHRDACYGAWFYFPRRYVATIWWNLVQFKSRSGAANDPFWSLQVGNRAGGAMHLYLNWWNGLAVEGPTRGGFGGHSYTQTINDLPVGRWTHVEVYLRQSGEFDGRIVVWQDGVRLFDLDQVRTRYPSPEGANEWSVNNYSAVLVPSPTTIYIDDATIRTALLAPPFTGAAPPDR